jgi:hypothetical protein
MPDWHELGRQQMPDVRAHSDPKGSERKYCPLAKNCEPSRPGNAADGTSSTHGDGNSSGHGHGCGPTLPLAPTHRHAAQLLSITHLLQ